MKTNWKSLHQSVSGLVLSWLLFSLAYPAMADGTNPPLKNDGLSVSSSAHGKPENHADWLRIDGEGIINAPLHVVALFFKDVKKAIRMTPGLSDKIVLRKISETERIDYDHFKLPWPFKDRYLIYRAEQEYDTGQEILFTLNSIENYPYEDKGKIPGMVRESSFLLQSLSENPSRTKVTVSMRIDPNGWLPVWLLNRHTQKWSAKLLRNLQQDIRKYLARQAS
jgi:hypothetical protein